LEDRPSVVGGALRLLKVGGKKGSKLKAERSKLKENARDISKLRRWEVEKP
jgi:hypothetical protein